MALSFKGLMISLFFLEQEGPAGTGLLVIYQFPCKDPARVQGTKFQRMFEQSATTHQFSEASSSRMVPSASRWGKLVVVLGRFLTLGGPTTPVLDSPARKDALALSTARVNVIESY